MNTLLFLLLAIGFFLVGFGVSQWYGSPRIEYRFIPRTFEEDQEDLPSQLDVFGDMFYGPNPWQNGTMLGPNTETPDDNYAFAGRYLT